MLGRKVLDPVKLVLRWDTAIDHDKCDYDAYQAAHYDFSKLVFNAGEKPTVFTLQQLTHEQRVAQSMLLRGENFEFSIRYGLTGISGYILEHADGSRHELEEPERKDTHLGKAITSKWLGRAGFDDEVLVSIATTIAEISQAKLPLSKPAAAPSGPGGKSTESEPAPP